MKSLKFDMWILEMEFFYVILIMIYVKFDILEKNSWLRLIKFDIFLLIKQYFLLFYFI